MLLLLSAYILIYRLITLNEKRNNMLKKKDKYNVAVFGATGAVGTEMLAILAERNFPIDELRLIASPKSEGKII